MDATPSSHAKTAIKDSITQGCFYAVYDSCIVNNAPTWDVAFIEQRMQYPFQLNFQSADEKYFLSLKEAKLYVKEHFQSHAEYFSFAQCNDPDNLFLILTDKLAYIMA